MTSARSLTGDPFVSAYKATKQGLLGLTEVVAPPMATRRRYPLERLGRVTVREWGRGWRACPRSRTSYGRPEAGEREDDSGN